MQQLKQKYSSYDSYVYLRVTFWESTGRAEMGERKAVLLCNTKGFLSPIKLSHTSLFLYYNILKNVEP